MIFPTCASARWSYAVLCVAVSLCCAALTARAQQSEAPQTGTESAAPDSDIEQQQANDKTNAELRAEVAELKAMQEAALAAAQDQAVDAEVNGADLLKIYGFMDFGLDKWFADTDGVGLLRPTRATTFVFGNLNLYFDATPTDRLRALVELRFTLAPNGEETQLGPPLGTSYERINTTTFDFSSPSSQSQLRLGGIFIERATGKYTFSELLRVEWGLFLNPFGIWNLDHGSPTLISLMLPMFISAQMLPSRLLGINVHGSWLSGPSELGYSLHISNGRTPLDFALTENKGLGARVFYANESRYGRVVLGASGYYGRYVDEEKQISPAGASSFISNNLFTSATTVDYTEYVLGLDFALNLGGLRVRSEAVFRWIGYNGDKTEKVLTTDGSLLYLPSRLEWSAYALAAYRTPWRIEPYVEYELANKSFTLPQWAGPARASSPDYSAMFLSGGINVALTMNLQLKAQVVWVRIYDGGFKHLGINFPVFFARAVLSF